MVSPTPLRKPRRWLRLVAWVLGVLILLLVGFYFVATSSGVPSNVRGLPVLVDANGKELTLEQMPQRLGKSVNGQVVYEITMVFRAGQGVGEPAQMVLYGHRLITAEAKFAFKNVPLP